MKIKKVAKKAIKKKTNKAVKARFKVTGTGKIKYAKPGRRHILTKKPSKRKRHLKKSGILHECREKTILKMI